MAIQFCIGTRTWFGRETDFLLAFKRALGKSCELSAVVAV